MSDRMTKAQWVDLRDRALTGIQAVLANRSYTLNGVTYNRENLPALEAFLDRCEARIAGFENSSGINVVQGTFA